MFVVMSIIAVRYACLELLLPICVHVGGSHVCHLCMCVCICTCMCSCACVCNMCVCVCTCVFTCSTPRDLTRHRQCSG